MTLFSRDFKVAYINPPVKVGNELPPEYIFKYLCKFINPNLLVMTPTRPAKLRGPKVQSYFTDLMKKFVRHFGFGGATLWFNMPEAGYLAGNLEDELIVYDCLDDYGSFSWTPELTVQADYMMTQKSDIVIVVSESLFNSKSRINPNCFLVPNGCDFDHFNKVTDSRLKTPADIKHITGPRIGFIGALYEWIDFDLLSYIAAAQPEWSIVLVGPVQSGVKTARLPNIHYLGRKPYRLLPNYLKEFDVCIIPFKQSATAISSSPIKFYEYLASGKPVVSTCIPDVARFGRMVMVPGTREEFIRGIRLLLAEPEDQKNMRRALQLSIARANTWDSRYRQLKTIMGKFP